ncbi:hypothetical protein ONZ51_g12609 [Trametes cubensis]|uniref:Uncharacterized protein n=1 Tax=Trametes cubensis TaxID=1111947 RepID=A0AAD7THY9_9APHY|nr:hypothetical protein ONZ51_g12609 [Trametes cubensis]
MQQYTPGQSIVFFWKCTVHLFNNNCQISIVLHCPRTLALNANQGCYKSQKFFQTHISGTCTNGYPDATTYTILTVKGVATTKGSKENLAGKIATFTNKANEPIVVATIGSVTASGDHRDLGDWDQL